MTTNNTITSLPPIDETEREEAMRYAPREVLLTHSERLILRDALALYEELRLQDAGACSDPEKLDEIHEEIDTSDSLYYRLGDVPGLMQFRYRRRS